jgi:hypothetical protein
MVVRTLTWMARQVTTDQLAAVQPMASALGLEVLAASAEQVTLRTARGDVLEYCAPDAAVPDHLFSKGPTVLGFEVDDLETTATALRAAGFRPLTDTVSAGVVRFQHFEGPEGAVYGLIEPIPVEPVPDGENESV